MKSAFLKTLENTAHRFDLWTHGDKIILAVSGGPDSMCLLDSLAKLGKKNAWTLHIAHVNYRLRGKDSENDEAFVQKHAKKYAIPLSVLHPKIAPNTPNLEAHLRDIRYRFFERLRKRLNFDSIAIAHTEDDQAETLLLRLIRGAGTRGLSAMRPKNGAIIRPFLLTPKSAILEHLKENNLSFCVDRTNLEPAFTRNRIRLELLPLLKEFNPNIKKTLAQTALTLADDGDALSFLCRTFFSEQKRVLKKEEKKEKKEKNGRKSTISFSAKKVSSLHPALQRAFLRMLSETHNPSEPPSFNETEEMRNMFRSDKKKHAAKTFRGLKLTRKGDTLTALSV